MMRRALPLIFAIALGLVGVVATQQYLRQQRMTFEREREELMANYAQPVQVIVAKKDIPEGTTLTAELLAAAEMPEKFIQPYATTRATDVLDQVTIAPIAEGEQILRNKVRQPGQALTGESLSKLTPAGKRAVTVGLDALTGVGGFIRPGDAVDVLWSFQAPTSGDPNAPADLVTTTLLQDVPVLAVGGRLLGGGTSRTREGRGRDDEDGQAQGQGYIVTVGLSPQEAELLLYARERGKVEVALRPHAPPEAQVAVRPADINLVMETVLGQAPAGAQGGPETQRSVEVFKGLERNVVTIQE